jgi:hypothetical protein
MGTSIRKGSNAAIASTGERLERPQAKRPLVLSKMAALFTRTLVAP